MANRIRLAEWPEPIFECKSDGWLTGAETCQGRLWWFPFVTVNRCSWCGKIVDPAKCAFDGCNKEALQLDWDRIQDVEVPFCMDHSYNGVAKNG